MEIEDAILAACLIKLWMNTIKDPLIPSSLYNYCINSTNATAPQLSVRKIGMRVSLTISRSLMKLGAVTEIPGRSQECDVSHGKNMSNGGSTRRGE